MISVAFLPNQKVKITELQRPGRILSVSIMSNEHKYYVRYFDNAEAKSEYFYEDELVGS